MKKKTIFNIIKAVSTILVVCLIYFYVGLILIPKDQNDSNYNLYYRANSINYEEKNSLDVIFYGDSNIAAAYSPMQIYENKQITSFIRSGSYESMISVYKNMKKDLKRQSPKLIVLETDVFYQYNTEDVNSQKYSSSILNPINFHSRWKEFSKEDFNIFSKKESDFLKGGIYYDKQVELNSSNFMNSTTRKKIKSSIKQDFEKVTKLCNDKNIKLVLVTCPSIEWSYPMHNDIVDISEKYGIPYHDFNTSEYKFQVNKSFRDNGIHCNKKGMKQVTQLIEDNILNDFEKQDHKDSVRNLWDNQLQKYKSVIDQECDLYNNTINMT